MGQLARMRTGIAFIALSLCAMTTSALAAGPLSALSEAAKIAGLTERMAASATGATRVDCARAPINAVLSVVESVPNPVLPIQLTPTAPQYPGPPLVGRDWNLAAAEEGARQLDALLVSQPLSRIMRGDYRALGSTGTSTRIQDTITPEITELLGARLNEIERGGERGDKTAVNLNHPLVTLGVRGVLEDEGLMREILNRTAPNGSYDRWRHSGVYTGSTGGVTPRIRARGYEPPFVGVRSQFFRDARHAGHADTTGERGESHRIVRDTDADRLLARLKDQYGAQLQLRDVPGDGKVFVTDTVIYGRVPYQVQDGRGVMERTGKVRERRFYQVDTGTGAVTPVDQTNGKFWLEVKMQHPELARRASIKPRILVADGDRAAILQPTEAGDRTRDGFLASLQRNGILQRTLALNPGEEDTVNAIFNVIGNLHAEGAHAGVDGVPMTPLVRTLNNRTAYALTLTDTAGKPVPIQLTVDKDITYLDPFTGKVIAAFPSDLRMIETKVPLDHVQLKGESQQEVTGLLPFAQWNRELQQTPRVPGFETDYGKTWYFRENRKVLTGADPAP